VPRVVGGVGVRVGSVGVRRGAGRSSLCLPAGGMWQLQLKLARVLAIVCESVWCGRGLARRGIHRGGAGVGGTPTNPKR
jgi:hypothetical protein